MNGQFNCRNSSIALDSRYMLPLLVNVSLLVVRSTPRCQAEIARHQLVGIVDISDWVLKPPGISVSRDGNIWFWMQNGLRALITCYVSRSDENKLLSYSLISGDTTREYAIVIGEYSHTHFYWATSISAHDYPGTHGVRRRCAGA